MARLPRVADRLAYEKGWLYADALKPIAQLDQNGNIKATFIYGTRAHVPDAMVLTDGTVYRCCVREHSVFTAAHLRQR